MKPTTGYPQELSLHGLPPTQGFRLVDSALLTPRAPSSPLPPPFASSSPLHTPHERRQHLIQVLDCAIALLDDDFDEDDSAFPSRTARSTN